jgi:microcystin-dependent protein
MQGQVAAGIGGTLGLTLGQEFGEVTHTLVAGELPSEFQYGQNIGGVQGGSDYEATVTPLEGGNVGHNNIQPSLGVNWIIKI